MRRLHFHEKKEISLNGGAIEVLQDKISGGKKNGRTETKERYVQNLKILTRLVQISYE